MRSIILSEVQVKFNNFEYSLKVLKKKLQREGVFKIMREKRHYEKPSEKKLRKRVEAQKRTHKVNKGSWN
ncbi:30S ribosomal protein S21 [Candidatus Bandiella euplotis]|uniref:Small ribosomal subunit protein bS21 n=1 Tax=Candidatus Bandiella euplotis TaxID=1664265 RepID=A0ABZ0UJA7_9RICK|nr:30S ribosomal protein S21 [Candidatus Bandiella woodruffii]WPX96190.1 30S ribosomal protein S21 [Candidatus Bandiella woodruffii]